MSAAGLFTAGLVVAAVTVLPGCADEDPADIGASTEDVIPENGPLPAGFPANAAGLVTACPTRNSESASRVVRGAPRIYKSSEQVDYLSAGWEDRIAKDTSFLDEATTLEPLDREGAAYSVVLIDIRKVGNKPHYYYYGNSNFARPTENWSSTKMVGVGMALHRLRFDSNGAIGGDATFPGGSIRDDMDDLNDHSSNVLGGWYKALAGPSRANAMLARWLLRPPGEGIGGFYAVSSWPAAYYTVNFTSADGQTSKRISIDDRGVGANSLSMLTQSEYMKRIGVNFQDPETLPKMVDYGRAMSVGELRSAAPSWTKADIVTMMYGDYPAGRRGGMMFDGLRDLPRSFTSDGHLGVPSHAHLDRISNGKWYTAAKGGSGCSDSRYKCEESLMAYICIPDANGGEGVEFALAARLSVPDSKGSPLGRLWKTYQRVVDAVYPGLREAPADTAAPRWCKVKTETGNVRRTPNGEVLTTLQMGASVRATTRTESGWYNVSFRLGGRDWSGLMHESVLACP